MSRLLWSLCALALLPAPNLRAEEAIQFRYQYSPSAKLLYRTAVTASQKQNVAGMDVENSQKTTEISEISLVETAQDGNFKLQSENKRMKVEMDIGPLGKYNFDSTSKENEKGSVLGTSLTPMYESMTGAYTFLTLTPRGEVTELKGFEETIKNALKDNPIAAQFAGGGTDEAAKMAYNMIMPIFPEKAISPGDTWEQPYNIALPKLGDMKGKRVLKFEGMESVNGQKVAKISVTTELSANINIDVENQAKVTGKVSVTKSSGTYLFDPAAGRLLKFEGSMEMDGDMTVEAGGQTIPIKQSQKQTQLYELIDKLPE